VDFLGTLEGAIKSHFLLSLVLDAKALTHLPQHPQFPMSQYSQLWNGSTDPHSGRGASQGGFSPHSDSCLDHKARLNLQ
jgi:hypothetical protein